jgi:peptidoglycan/xylan/chitin deacetylase (PgdA/CDA1 family)
MLKQAMLRVLGLAEASGLSRSLSASGWRRRRLLILCYHGVSKYDEHEWANFYIAADTFRRRMQILKDFGCNVLPLSEALTRLRDGTLPERAVALTFDDGFHDYYSVAFPILESFGFPATLYLTTYYVEFNRPVFDPMCSYLLWKARQRQPERDRSAAEEIPRSAAGATWGSGGNPEKPQRGDAGQELEWPEVFGAPAALDDVGRRGAAAAIKQFALKRKLSGREKDDLLAQLADRLGLDYQDLCRKRVLHLITPEEATELATRGADLQYHTHRHRVYRSRERMFAELQDNRRRIVTYTSKEPRHYCYTGSFYLPQHPGYLREYGIQSATTLARGLCTTRTDPFLLPRIGDGMALSELEFRAWLAGTADFLPRRRIKMSAGQLMEEEDLAIA